MKNTCHALSLIEVLFSIMILAVVMGLGVGAVTRLQRDAGDRAVVAKIKQLNLAKGQFILERGRLEAEALWNSPPDDTSPTNTAEQNRYGLLKRYIERPQMEFSQVPPRGYTITTPTNVHAGYSGNRVDPPESFTDEY